MLVPPYLRDRIFILRSKGQVVTGRQAAGESKESGLRCMHCAVRHSNWQSSEGYWLGSVQNPAACASGSNLRATQ